VNVMAFTVSFSPSAAVAKMLTYLAIEDEPVGADIIWALGSNDTHVPMRAVDCYKRGLAPWVVFSGGNGHRWADLSTTEADVFRGAAIAAGVPADRIVIEDRSSNTAENVQFTLPILRARDIPVRNAILITIPPFQRRASLTIATHEPALHCLNAPADWGDPTAWSPTDLVRGAQLCVGEIDRLQDYPARGFIRFDPSTLPAEILETAGLLRASLDALRAT